MIYFILFTHWVADFVLQTDKQAKNKSISISYLTQHLCVYTLCLIPFGVKFAFINGISHWFIDFLTSKGTRYFYSKGQVHNFFVVVGFDQMLHVCILIYTLDFVRPIWRLL